MHTFPMPDTTGRITLAFYDLQTMVNVWALEPTGDSWQIVRFPDHPTRRTLLGEVDAPEAVEVCDRVDAVYISWPGSNLDPDHDTGPYAYPEPGTAHDSIGFEACRNCRVRLMDTSTHITYEGEYACQYCIESAGVECDEDCPACNAD